jgi:hypothetical protein
MKQIQVDSFDVHLMSSFCELNEFELYYTTITLYKVKSILVDIQVYMGYTRGTQNIQGVYKGYTQYTGYTGAV